MFFALVARQHVYFSLLDEHFTVLCKMAILTLGQRVDGTKTEKTNGTFPLIGLSLDLPFS